MRSARVRAEREQRIRRLSALNDLAWQLAGVHEPFGIARLAYEAAGALVARDSFYVARYDAGKKEFDFVLQAEGTDSWVGERYPLGTGPTSQVVLTGETYLVKGPGDPVQRQGMTFGETERHPASAVHVPLKSRGRLVGVLSSQAYRPGAFDAEDIAVLQSLANLVATAFENAEHLAQMRELYLASVKALAAAVDARDPYTRSHSARVAALARTIADEMRMSADQLRRVQLGALLHDIGKIGVPDAILNKPGRADRRRVGASCARIPRSAGRSSPRSSRSATSCRSSRRTTSASTAPAIPTSSRATPSRSRRMSSRPRMRSRSS